MFAMSHARPTKDITIEMAILYYNSKTRILRLFCEKKVAMKFVTRIIRDYNLWEIDRPMTWKPSNWSTDQFQTFQFEHLF